MTSSFRQCIRRSLPHFGLLLGVISYILLGAVVFMAIEHKSEMVRKQEALELLEGILDHTANQLHHSCYTKDTILPIWRTEYRSRIMELLEEWNRANYLAETNLNPRELYSDIVSDKDSSWNFGPSVLFSFSMVTTIGKGNHFPSTTVGRAVCIIYALLGIPLTLITVSNLGKFLAAFLLIILRKCQKISRKKFHKPSTPTKVIYHEASGGDLIKRPPTPSENNTLSCIIILGTFLAFIVTGAFCISLWKKQHFFDSLFHLFTAVFTINLNEPSPLLEPGYIFVIIIFALFGLILMTLVLGMTAVIVRKIHYSGQRPLSVREASVWFGSDRLTTEQLARALAKYCNIKPTSVDGLVDDLPRIVHNAIAEKHGKAPAELEFTLQQACHPRFGILFSIANDSIQFMDDTSVSSHQPPIMI